MKRGVSVSEAFLTPIERGLEKIRIDGSYGEGGGQILRTALSLSSILNKPFEIYNIRKGRKKPGLLPQHLTGVNAAQIITKAKVKGNSFGSLNLIFEPEQIVAGDYEFNVAEERGSAGAVTLVAQTILPILCFASKASRVIIKGGTHVPFSPPFEYLKEVLIPTIKNLGFNAEASLRKFGFYPVGGGEISLVVNPQESSGAIHRIPKNEPVGLTERSELRELSLISRVANLPKSIAERQAKRFLDLITSEIKEKIEPKEEVISAPSPGTYLFLKAVYENAIAGFSSLGARGKPAEKVADEVYENFSEYNSRRGALDPNLADQILIFLALTNRRIRESAQFTTTKVTNHLLTNIWVIKQFLNINIELEGSLGSEGRVFVKSCP